MILSKFQIPGSKIQTIHKIQIPNCWNVRGFTLVLSTGSACGKHLPEKKDSFFSIILRFNAVDLQSVMVQE